MNNLPPYLPPYIPMGQIRVSSGLSEKSAWYHPGNVGSIYFWNVILTGENISSDMMPEIRQQIRNSKNIRFLPAEVTRQTLKSPDQLIQQVSYSIPFVLNKSGLLSLPEIRLQYFDTQEQRMHTSAFSMGKIFSLHSYLKWLILVAITALMLWVFWRLIPVAVMSAGQLRHLYRARTKLKKATTPTEVREAMRMLGVSFGWPLNMALSHWHECWKENFRGDDNLTAMLDSLRKTLYGHSPCDTACEKLPGYILATGYLDQLKACLLAAVKQPGAVS